MAKPIPTLVELYSRISADLINKLGLVLPAGQLKTVLDAVASNLAGELKLLYLYQVDIQNELFPDTATPASQGGQLNRWGQLFLKRQPYPATDGYYTASVTGSAGATLPAQLTFKSNADSNAPGFLYILDTGYTLTGSGDVITLRALNAGEDYLLNVNDNLTATQPLLNASQQVTITAVTTQPTEAESIPLYQQQIIAAIRLQAQGGADTDYRLWSADAAGVQQVYPQVKNGDAGVVQVFVEATPVDSTDGNGTPSAALLAAVEAVLMFSPDTTLDTNYRGRRPTQAILEVDPVITIPVDLQITGLQTSNATVQGTIQTNLIAFLQTVRPYIPACDLSTDRNDTLTNVKAQSVVSDTIGNANTFNAFQLLVDGVVTNSYQFAEGNIPYLRNVTYN